jgi:tetratricopeptide (TPR) repeat protein
MSTEVLQCSLCLLMCAGALLPRSADDISVCTQALNHVEQLLKDKRHEEAGAALDKAKNCAPASPFERFRLGWLYGRSRRFADALKIFETVPADVPDRVSHQYVVALSRFELGDYGRAVEALRALEADGPLDPDSANLLSVSYSKLRLYKQAESTLNREIQAHPNDLSARLNLVTLYADQDRFTDSARVASEAAEAFPNDAKVLVVRGAANTLIGKLDQAYDDFSASAKIEPANADTQFFLALTRYKQGNFRDALRSLEAANNSGIVDSDLHYLMAECLLKVDASRTKDAMRELNRAIELNSSSVSARAVRGKLLLEAGHPTEALTDLKLAHGRDPDSRSAAYNLARAYRATGQIEEANRLFGQLRNQKADSLGELSQRRLSDALAQTEVDR